MTVTFADVSALPGSLGFPSPPVPAAGVADLGTAAETWTAPPVVAGTTLQGTVKVEAGTPGAPDYAATLMLLTFSVNNAQPVADAGPAQGVITGNLATLDGSASSDANGDVLTYAWSFVSSPGGSAIVDATALSNTTIVNPTFTPDVDGAYVWQLIVNDGTVDSAASQVTITAGPNATPVANAGPPQTVLPGTPVTLDGSASSDGNGDPLTYAWSFVSAPVTSAIVDATALSSTTAVNPTFTPDVAGNFVWQLIVNDGLVNSLPSTVTITANTPPVASAGANQNVVTGALVTLDGSGSSDADANPLTYAWSMVSVPGGSLVSTASLSSATVVNPDFTPDVDGAYVWSLVVNDGVVNSIASQVTVTSSTPPAVTGVALIVADPPLASSVDLTASTYTAGIGVATLYTVTLSNLTPVGNVTVTVTDDDVGSTPAVCTGLSADTLVACVFTTGAAGTILSITVDGSATVTGVYYDIAVN
jgi:hypothetical protein